LPCADELDPLHRPQPQGLRSGGKLRRVALPVEGGTQRLCSLRQRRDPLMLARDLIGLLLHHRVEQENTEYADGEHKSETGGERRLATAWCRRTRGHQSRR
jgi:hypothetical protein